MVKSTVAKRTAIAVLAFSSLLAVAGCSPGHIAYTHSTVPRALCSSWAPAYLFPSGSAPVSYGESTTWRRLSLFSSGHMPASVASDERVEAVLPGVTWTLKDIYVGAKAGKHIQTIASHAVLHRDVLSAMICSASNITQLSQLKLARGPKAQRATELIAGIYDIAPVNMRPGGTLSVLVIPGSYEAYVYEHDSNPLMRWYAVSTTAPTIYPVSLIEDLHDDNMYVYLFGLAPQIASGSYELALSTPAQIKPLNAGFMNGEDTGGFTFEVR